ncbi:alpha/beta fold hydrolase [Phaeacidiphilus oryzae]|uniref:alpha/beta fold hydrolase n=1 Tax=Phaeacidiphilus oryzae TaxID=348818 RepID=UPI000568499F|nr:alpha/beta fold hydrolase [Phaeacidiphilus oryzae]
MTDRISVRESGSGTPLVLLHAFPLNSSMWQSQLDELPGREGTDARVIAVDLRGFGGTPLGEDAPSLDLLADDLALMLDRAGIDRAVLCGLSMGGYTAMAFARRHPERLLGLILADTKATADDEAAKANRERIARTVTEEKSVRVVVEEQLPEPLLGAEAVRRGPELVDHVRRIAEAAPPESVAWAQRAMAARGDSLDVLRGVTVPALVVVGEDDAITGVADARAMAKALPASELTILPGAGHLSSLEVPEAFNDAVRGWLRQLP